MARPRVGVNTLARSEKYSPQRRRELAAKLNALQARAAAANALTPDELRREFVEILTEYVGDTPQLPALLASVDEVTSRYRELTDAVARQQALETLFRSLGASD